MGRGLGVGFVIEEGGVVYFLIPILVSLQKNKRRGLVRRVGKWRGGGSAKGKLRRYKGR